MNSRAEPRSRSDKPVILVIEDDRYLREGLAMNLRMEGYTVVTAADGDAGMKQAFDSRPNMVIIDIMLPGWSGLDILEELRRRGENMPVLVLSARGTAPHKVEGLKLGADDYMSKPFDLPELLARVEAMLRRRHSEQQSIPPLVFGSLVIDLVGRSVAIDNRAVELSAREFDLLCVLAKSPGKVFTREAILEHVWGWGYEGTNRTVDNFVVSLRKKMERCRCVPAHIKTVPRVGYKFEVG